MTEQLFRATIHGTETLLRKVDCDKRELKYADSECLVRVGKDDSAYHFNSYAHPDLRPVRVVDMDAVVIEGVTAGEYEHFICVAVGKYPYPTMRGIKEAEETGKKLFAQLTPRHRGGSMTTEMSNGRRLYAAGVIGIHIIENAVEGYIGEAWEDYPEIGEHDWTYIQEHVGKMISELKDREDYDEADSDNDFDACYAEFSAQAEDDMETTRRNRQRLGNDTIVQDCKIDVLKYVLALLTEGEE